tara:strand:- start:91 stop:267 length:177 start_codon:yes stop_codon:yes gene_type:complete
MKTYVSLDSFPDKQDFATAKGTNVMSSFKKYAVFESLTDGSGVILDPCSKFVSGEVNL